MHWVYLKSKNAHINLDHVESVHHDVEGSEGTATAIYFTNHRRRSRMILVFDSSDRDYLRYLLNCYGGGWDEQERKSNESG